MSAGKLKQKEIYITCQYCKSYTTLKKMDAGKFCDIINLAIMADDKICKEFKPSNEIFCDSNSYFLKIEVCLNRLSKGNKYCNKCNQAKIIKKLNMDNKNGTNNSL